MADGAYPDDMARFLRLSDEDVERLFRGEPPEEDEDLRALAFFLTDAAESLSTPPSGRIQARHLALLTEAAGPGSHPDRRSTTPVRLAHPAERMSPVVRRSVRWAATVVTAAASLVLLSGGLALAGVDLPGTAAETAFEKILGVNLPNQDRDAAADAADPSKLPADASDTAVGVHTVIQEWFEGAPWSGCEFGARVSHAARGLEGEADTSRCDAAGSERGGSSSEGSGSNASGNAGKGHEVADEASGGASSNGADAVGAGGDVAEDVSGGASEAAGASAGS
jgi:hypothetical protein